MPALLDLLPAPGRATLDVACGEGRLTRHLHSLGHRVTGIDASPTMVRFAGGHPSAAPTLLADATGLPFRDGAFDLAVAYMCLHDIDDMPLAIAEIARVLGRPGQLCAAIPHPINTAGSFQDRDAGAPFVIRCRTRPCRPALAAHSALPAPAGDQNMSHISGRSG